METEDMGRVNTAWWVNENGKVVKIALYEWYNPLRRQKPKYIDILVISISGRRLHLDLYIVDNTGPSPVRHHSYQEDVKVGGNLWFANPSELEKSIKKGVKETEMRIIDTIHGYVAKAL